MFARIELPAALALAVIALAAPALLLYCAAAQFALHFAVLLGRPQRTSEQKLFDGLLVLLCIVSLVNCLVSPFPDRSIPQALRLLSGIGLIRAALGLPNNVKTLRTYFIGLGALSLTSAVAGHLSAFLPSLELLAAPFFFIPANVGALLAPRSMLLSPRVRLLHLIAVLLGIFAVVRQFWNAPAWDETLIPALVVGTTAAALLRPARLQPAMQQALPVLLLLLGAAQLLLPLTPHQWALLLADPSLEQRHELWSRAAHVIRAFPFTGAGMDAFGPIVDALYPLTLSGATQDTQHTFLQIATDTGIPGALIVSLIWLHSTRLLTARIRPASTSSTAHWMASYAIALQISVLIAGLSRVVLWGAAPLAPFAWLTFALAVRLSARDMGPQQIQATLQTTLQGDAR
jgi:hypothetical protein